MKKLLVLALFLGACKTAPTVPPATPAASLPTAKPVIPVTPPVVIPDDANFVLQVDEVVGSAEDDIASYTKVYVDNASAGQTEINAKSKSKKWGAKLAPGNHLFRFEKWNLPPTGDWQMLDPQWQPPERFIRVEDGQKTTVTVRFYDNGRKFDLQSARKPLGQ